MSTPAPTDIKQAEGAKAGGPPPEPKQLKLKIDGLDVDGGVFLNFSGRIKLEPTTEADAKMIDDLRLGREITVPIMAYVVSTGGKGKRTKEGDLGDVTKAIGLKIHSIANAAFSVIGRP